MKLKLVTRAGHSSTCLSSLQSGGRGQRVRRVVALGAFPSAAENPALLCIPIIPEREGGGASEVQGHPRLQSEF